MKTCPTCRQNVADDFKEKLKAQYKEIYKLWDAGKKGREISRLLSITSGRVQYAIQQRRNV